MTDFETFMASEAKKEVSPARITVLGKPYAVHYDDEDHSHGMLGATRASMQYIRINKDQAPDQIAETILHEVIHIVDRELVLNLSEETVARLAVGLYSAGYRHRGDK